MKKQLFILVLMLLPLVANADDATVEITGIDFLLRKQPLTADKVSKNVEPIEKSTHSLEGDIIDIDSYKPDYTWISGYFSKTSADGKNVLLAPNTDATLTLDESIEPATVVYKEPVVLTVCGTGAIGGTASVNKAGEGTLCLQTTNTYTGATVVHDGVLEFSTLKNGGEPSSIGASVEFAQNWILDGGTCRYTGTNTTTNRSAKLSASSVLDITKALCLPTT